MFSFRKKKMDVYLHVYRGKSYQEVYRVDPKGSRIKISIEGKPEDVELILNHMKNAIIEKNGCFDENPGYVTALILRKEIE